MGEAKLIGGRLFDGKIADPRSDGVAQILGEWRNPVGGTVTRWGIAPGTPCPALVLTDENDNLRALIPFNALRDVLRIIGY